MNFFRIKKKKTVVSTGMSKTRFLQSKICKAIHLRSVSTAPCMAPVVKIVVIFPAIKKTMQSEIISAIFHGDMSGLV